MPRPRILITLDTGEELRRGVPFPSVHLKAAYAEMIERAGGAPILAAPTADEALPDELCAWTDGLVLTGGAFDIDPALYGRSAETGVRVDTSKPLRTRFEWRLLQAALSRGRPVLGVCGGMQLLNVVLGGTLHLDIQAEIPGARPHEQESSPAGPAHAVHLAGALAGLLGPTVQVNSTHHQAVHRLGDGLVALGRSDDGVVEAIGLGERGLRVLGVQWHPELLADPASLALYRNLVEQTRG